MDFDPGPVSEPFATLVREAPAGDVYPPSDFRVEWGPIFHRGRLDGTARILIVGQDPGQHESVARRILVGEAGQRVQGFLARLGIDREYVMVNAFLYSVFGQSGGEKHAKDAAIEAYRARWLDALLGGSPIEAVISFGHLGRVAFERWREGPGAAHAGVPFEPLTHPTQPEAVAAQGPGKRDEAMRKMLAQWNEALGRLGPILGVGQPSLYGEDLLPEDRSAIPDFDLPAGSPPWFRSLKQWASREAIGKFADGDDAARTEAKRATIVVTVPRAERPWHDA
jgi:uracil-DNA glycosylase